MLRISNNKIILFTAILLCLGIISIKYAPVLYNTHIDHEINSNDNNCKHDIPSQNASTAYEQLKQEMNDQEQKAWDLLQTDTGISKEECLEKQKKNSASYKRLQKQGQRCARCLYKKLKAETILFVQNIVRDFGLNPADIQIVPYKGYGSPAAADDSTIFIDEKEFALYSPKACEFIIAHEISHMQAQDDSTFQSLYALTHRKKTSRQKTKKALEAFCRFQETRADMNALLHGGKKYIPGVFESLYKLQELESGHKPSVEHPKTSDRIKTAQHICTKMGWNVKEKDYVAHA